MMFKLLNLTYFLIIFISFTSSQLLDIAIDEPKNEAEIEFMQKLQNQGVSFDFLDLANFTNPIFSNFKLRGVKAKKNIVYGDEMFSIPKNLMFTTIIERNSRLYGIRELSNKTYSLELILTMKLLSEFAGNSSLNYYFQVLPTNFFTPSEYSAAEIRLLDGSLLQDEIYKRQKLFEDEYSKISSLLVKYPNMLGGLKLSFEIFKYARLIVQTRAFAMHLDGVDVLGIVPFADMLNHKPNAKIQWQYDSQHQRFRLLALESYAEGTQVYNSYGQKSNRKLLLDFGFVVLNNPNDFVEFPGPEIAQTEVKKLSVLEKSGMPYQRLYPVFLGKLPWNLMFATRLALSTQTEFAQLMRIVNKKDVQRRNMIPTQYNITISVSNEIATLIWLKNATQYLLAKYPDTYEADTVLLQQSEGMDRNTFNSILVRHDEKRVYSFISNFVDAHLPVLELLNEFTAYGPATSARVALSEMDFYQNVVVPVVENDLKPPNPADLSSILKKN